MEKRLDGISVLQKNKGTETSLENTASSCCSKPTDATFCCTPGQSLEENNGACCAQPEDGSSCCDR